MAGSQGGVPKIKEVRRKREETKLPLNFTRQLSELTRTVDNLIRVNKGLLKPGGPPLGSGGGRGSTPGNEGAGISRMGSALPVAGVALGVLGFATSQVLKMGRGYISEAQKQMHSSGMSGFKKRGAYSYFSPDELSAAQKARIMAAGSYDAGKGEDDWTVKKHPDRYTRYKNTSQYKRMMSHKSADPDEDYFLKQKVKKQANKIIKIPGKTEYIPPKHLDIDYAKMFGTGGNELYEQLGLLDRMGGGKGGRSRFSKMIGAAQSGGIQSDMPVMMQMISNTMRESIKQGVNDSDLAVEMAKEVGKTYRTSGQSVEHIISGMTARRGVQKAVSEGNISGSIESYYLWKSAMSEVEKMIAGKGDRKLWSKWAKEGYVQPGENLDYQDKSFLAQKYSVLGRPGQVNAAYEQFIKKFAGGGSKSSQLRKSGFWATQLGFSGELNERNTKFQDLLYGDKTLNIKKGIEEFEKESKKRTQNDSFDAVRLENQRKILQLGVASKTAAEGVKAFETACYTAADKIQNVVFKDLNKALNTVQDKYDTK